MAFRLDKGVVYSSFSLLLSQVMVEKKTFIKSFFLGDGYSRTPKDGTILSSE